MARSSKDVTEAELSVLQVIWEHGPATIRLIADELYPQGGTSPYATVQKLLERLERKGFVARRRARGAHVFRAVIGRQDLVGRRLEDITKGLCGGSIAPLITHLAESEQLTAAERAALRRLIDTPRSASRSRPGTSRRRS